MAVSLPPLLWHHHRPLFKHYSSSATFQMEVTKVTSPQHCLVCVLVWSELLCHILKGD